MNYYKPILRHYLDENYNYKRVSIFIAVGQMADGHLVYCRCNEKGETSN